MKKIIALIFMILVVKLSYSQRFNLNAGYKNCMILYNDDKNIYFQGLTLEYTFYPIKSAGLFMGFSFFPPVTYYGLIKGWDGVNDLKVPVYITGSAIDFSSGGKLNIYTSKHGHTTVFLTGSFCQFSHKGIYNKIPFYRNFDLSGDDVRDNLFGVSAGLGIRQYIFNIPFYFDARYLKTNETEKEGWYNVQPFKTKFSFSCGISLPAIRPQRINTVKIEY